MGEGSWTRRWTEATADQAEIYDTVLVPGVFGPCAGRLVALAVSGREGTVLDAGCGTGAVARAVSVLLEPMASVVAVDVNASMLDAARRHQVGGDAAVDFETETGDLRELPFSEGVFDLVLCQHVLQYVADRAGAVRELARVVKPGGPVWVVVWGALADNPLFAAVTELVDVTWGPEVAARFAGPWSVPPDRVQEHMVHAGLTGLRAHRIEFEAMFPSREDIMWIVAFSPVGALLQRLVPEARGDFAARVLRLAGNGHPTGAVRVPVVAWAVQGRRPP